MTRLICYRVADMCSFPFFKRRTMKYIVILSTILLYLTGTKSDDDIPCAARSIKGKSVVCVCNITYCDTISRETPAPEKYVVYISSKKGSRFNKTTGNLQPLNDSETSCCSRVLSVNPNVKYQTIEGFGGAVTDAAGINWKNLSIVLQKYLIDSYYSVSGLEYNLIRTPIGGSDFSTRGYAYNDLPENDTHLTNFTLVYEDYHYKIPMIKAAMQAAKSQIHVVATTWSPPVWMKTVARYTGSGYLKPEYYQTYADYHKKFVEQYTKEGIPVWGITTTNEPTNCVIGVSPINCLGWTASNLGKWVVNYLGPTIRNSTFKDLKIIAVDDQRITLPYWFNVMVMEHPEVLRYIDGVGVHYYTDKLTPSSFLSEVALMHPEKFILATEACEGSLPWDRKKVDFGSWQRAKNYVTDIISDLTHSVVGWMDWNLCLNASGGPNWVNNNVDSPIIVFPEKEAFIKQPMFYAMGHFSKFIPRGSRRVELTEKHSILRASMDCAAFLTPNNTVVIVLYNNGLPTTMKVKLEDKEALVYIEGDAIATVELPYNK